MHFIKLYQVNGEATYINVAHIAQVFEQVTPNLRRGAVRLASGEVVAEQSLHAKDIMDMIHELAPVL